MRSWTWSMSTWTRRSESKRAPTPPVTTRRTHDGRDGGGAEGGGSPPSGASAGRAPDGCGTVGSLQRLDDPQRAGAAGERLRARERALDKVLRREEQRLGRRWHLDRMGGEMANGDDRGRPAAVGRV